MLWVTFKILIPQSRHRCYTGAGIDSEKKPVTSLRHRSIFWPLSGKIKGAKSVKALIPVYLVVWSSRDVAFSVLKFWSLTQHLLSKKQETFHIANEIWLSEHLEISSGVEQGSLNLTAELILQCWQIYQITMNKDIVTINIWKYL